jgi:hypothetical protein
VLITNFILRETPIEGGEPKARRSVWEGLCGHFGNRTLEGLYLGAHVDGASGVFRH